VETLKLLRQQRGAIAMRLTVFGTLLSRGDTNPSRRLIELRESR